MVKIETNKKISFLTAMTSSGKYLLIAIGITLPQGFNSDYLRSIEIWCLQNTCGKRVNPVTFSFNSEEDRCFFLLKWG